MILIIKISASQNGQKKRKRVNFIFFKLLALVLGMLLVSICLVNIPIGKISLNPFAGGEGWVWESDL